MSAAETSTTPLLRNFNRIVAPRTFEVVEPLVAQRPHDRKLFADIPEAVMREIADFLDFSSAASFVAANKKVRGATEKLVLRKEALALDANIEKMQRILASFTAAAFFPLTPNKRCFAGLTLFVMSAFLGIGVLMPSLAIKNL